MVILKLLLLVIFHKVIQMNETQSTLNFIQRAKMIKNKSKII